MSDDIQRGPGGGAEIFAFAKNVTDPRLLMQMILANVKGDISSVVVSVIVDGFQDTFHTSMQNKELAYHLVCINHDLNRGLFDPTLQRPREEG